MVSLDNDHRRRADITQNILTWDYKNAFSPGFFDIPCTEYSSAKTVGHRRLDYADRIVEKTLEIIQFFDPPIWWIENPRLGLLKDREIMRGIPYIDVDYCKFENWGYKKPTRIWVCEQLAKLPKHYVQAIHAQIIMKMGINIGCILGV